MKNFKGIIFDMDGVILDSERALMEVWIELSLKHNLKNIEEVYLKCTGANVNKTKEILLDFYGKDFPYDSYAKETTEIYFNKYKDFKLPLKKGVFELLNYLKNNNITIALASSTKKDLVLKELCAHDLLKYFDVIVTGDMVSRSKPEPDIYLKAIELLKIDASKLFAIEDSFNGVKSAAKANLKTIMVPDLVMPNDEIKTKAYIILKDLNEVINFLDE